MQTIQAGLPTGGLSVVNWARALEPVQSVGLGRRNALGFLEKKQRSWREPRRFASSVYAVCQEVMLADRELGYSMVSYTSRGPHIWRATITFPTVGTFKSVVTSFESVSLMESSIYTI